MSPFSGHRAQSSSDRHGKVLEIGCGDGRKLAVFHRLGFSCFGFEPSSRDLGTAASYGVPVSPRMFDVDLALSWGPFDYLFLSNVLEHVPDPEGLLRAVRPLLVPDGQLFINVPNDLNALQTAYLESSGREAWFIDPPEHLSYFSSETLSRLCAAVGFEVVRKTTRFPMEMFLRMGDDYGSDPRKGRRCHQRRVAFERSFMHGLELVLWSFYDGLASRGFGRELIFLCRPSPPAESGRSHPQAS
jgi:SAM-dependent methyltransferase